MDQVITGLGRLLCRAVSTIGILSADRCFDYSKLRVIGVTSMALLAVVLVGWRVLRR